MSGSDCLHSRAPVLKPRFSRSTLVVLALLSCSAACMGQSSSAERSPCYVNLSRAKLVAPNVGWAIVKRPSRKSTARDGCEQRIYWTDNDGGTWRDITPKPMPVPSIGQVFFLDRLHGWIISQKADAANNQCAYYFFSTTDGGKHWSLLKFDQKTYRFVDQLSPAQIFFSDPQHGWILFNLMVTHIVIHALLRTTDGGKTFKPFPGPPGSGPLTFISPTLGWLIGHRPSEDLFPGPDQIWSTHDGGATWKPLSVGLPASPDLGFKAFGMESSRDGVLAGDIYPAGRTGKFFDCITHSGGGAWRCSRFKAHNAEPSVVDLHVIWTVIENYGPWAERISVRRGNHVIVPSIPTQLAPGGFLGWRDRGIDFVDDSHGWATYVDLNAPGFAQMDPLLAPVQLISTADGGKTFHVVTPPAAIRNGRISTLQ